MTNQDVELTKIIDSLLAAQQLAIALGHEKLTYLIGLALDAAKGERQH